MVASNVVLTNSAGVHAPAVAESVLAMMLHFARGLDYAVRAQAHAEWKTDPVSTRPGAVTEIGGATLGVLGLGGIGREVAWRAHALGMSVLALRRSDQAAPDGVQLLSGPDALDQLLARSDYVVLSLPSTPATRGLLGAGEISRIKPGAVLINVAR